MLAAAHQVAERIGDPILLSDVLNNVAFGELVERRDWTGPMLEALRLSLEAGAEAQAGRCLCQHLHLLRRRVPVPRGRALLARRDRLLRRARHHDVLHLPARPPRGGAVRRRAAGTRPSAIAERVLATEASPVNLLTSQNTLGLIRARRGVGDPFEVLDAAVEAADGLDETPWVALTRLARAEAPLARRATTKALPTTCAAIRARVTPMDFEEDAPLSVWENRLFGAATPASPVKEPWTPWVAGDHVAAAAAWDRVGCPYYAAQALADSDREEHLRDALSRFEALGAEAAARRTRNRLKDLGHRAPAGARASTREHPLGLTRREDEVLVLAVRRPHQRRDRRPGWCCRRRTVDHHVSAVLAKLGVGSRTAAAAAAAQRGSGPGHHLVLAASHRAPKRAIWVVA